MRSLTLKLGLVLALALTVGLQAGAPARAAAQTSTVNFYFPFATSLQNTCNGETVDVSGMLHGLMHISTDANGNMLIDVLYNPQGVSGIGETSGATYRGTGETRYVVHAVAGVQTNFTYVNNFDMISSGSTPNIRVHENIHITVNPDGTVTSSVDNFSVTCL